MTTTLQIPVAEEIGDFLSNLYGLQVSTKPASPLDVEKARAMADYVDDQGNVKAVVACDISGAAKLGAALTQIPVGGVEDSIDEDELSNSLSENLLEVFNIAVNVFRESHSHRLVVNQITLGSEAAKLTAEATSSAEATHYELDIERYGSGAISFFTFS